MDAQVGHVIDKLDALGLSENTLIVFTSDHGYHLGEHGLWQKQSVFEESARVPLLLAGPGVKQPGSVVQSPVGLIDLYPTLTELAHVQAPATIQGQSLAPMLEDPSHAGRGYALTQVLRRGKDESGEAANFDGYSIRTPRWRYTECSMEQRAANSTTTLALQRSIEPLTSSIQLLFQSNHARRCSWGTEISQPITRLQPMTERLHALPGS
jgi:arylsulfatase A-like enzyme